MAAVVVDVADAVTAQLNAASLSQTIEAVRTYNKRRLSIAELEQLAVDVIPVMWTSGIGDRSGSEHRPTVDVFIRRKLGISDQERTGDVEGSEVDALVLLAEEAAELFEPSDTKDGRLDTYDDAAWIKTEVLAGCVDDEFAETRIFLAQIRLTFEVG